MKTHPAVVRLLLKAMAVWGSVSLLTLVNGCLARTHHYSASHSSSVAATPGSNWSDEHKMVFRYGIRDDRAALESKRVVLVFRDLTPEQKRLFHFQREEQPVQIGGEGISSVTTTCANGKVMVRFRSDYANGTNTLQFGDQKVQFIESGRVLLAGDLAVELSNGRKVVQLTGAKARLE